MAEERFHGRITERGKMPMTAIDYAIVLLYLLFVAGIGIAVRTRIAGLDDYFAGGHKVPWWLAAVSHHISGYSAFAFVAYAGVAYTVGFNVWTLFAVPCFLAMTAGAFVWAPRWSRLKVITPVQYLEERFNRPVHQTIAWSGIAIKFLDVGLKLYSLALIIYVCVGLPLNWTIVGCGVVALLYLSLGGLWAVMITDFVQFFIQLASTVILAFVALTAVGGWNNMWASLPPSHQNLFSEQYSLLYVLVFLVPVTLSYNGGTWGLAQRFYSIGKASDARKAALLSAGMYLIYPLILYTPAWAAPVLLGPIENPEQVYALMASQYFPTLMPGLLGLFVAAMFAATMSMIDSDLNAMAAVFTKDIYQRVRTAASERTLMKAGLLVTIIFGTISVVGGIITPLLGGAFEAMMQWYAALLAPVAVPLLFGMLNKRTTWRGALAAWAGGFIAFVLLRYGLPAFGIESTWVIYTGGSLLATFAIFFVEGYIGRLTAEESERVDKLFHRIASRELRKPAEPEAVGGEPGTKS